MTRATAFNPCDASPLLAGLPLAVLLLAVRLVADQRLDVARVLADVGQLPVRLLGIVPGVDPAHG